MPLGHSALTVTSNCDSDVAEMPPSDSLYWERGSRPKVVLAFAAAAKSPSYDASMKYGAAWLVMWGEKGAEEENKDKILSEGGGQRPPSFACLLHVERLVVAGKP